MRRGGKDYRAAYAEVAEEHFSEIAVDDFVRFRIEHADFRIFEGKSLRGGTERCVRFQPYKRRDGGRYRVPDGRGEPITVSVEPVPG